MKNRVLLGLLALGLTICLAGAPAQAQNSKLNVFAGYSYGINNIGCSSSGYCSSDPGLHGYSVAATYNFNNHIGLEGNFSGHNGTSLTYTEGASSTYDGYADSLEQDLYTYTFGPRVSLPVGNFSLFTHFLVGGVHVHEAFKETCIQSSGSDVGTCPTAPYYTDIAHGNGFAFKTGGGVDWNHGRWGIRILEVDYIRNDLVATEPATCSSCTTNSSTVSGNNFELATGITFNFGGTH